MLNLNAFYTPSPSIPFHHLTFHDQSFLIYPSADAIVLLDSSTFDLVRVLAFRDAFPDVLGPSPKISAVAMDSGMKFIVAAMDNRLAAWSLSDVDKRTWRVHSTLRLPEDLSISALACKAGLLAVGFSRGLSVYTLILDNDLPTWSQKWTVRDPPPSHIRFAPSLMSIASSNKEDNNIRIYSTTSGRQMQMIPHPRPVANLAWRTSLTSSRNDLILYTVTTDSTIRIFLPILDSPHCLQLHAAVDLYSALPYSVVSSYTSTEISRTKAFWLDKDVVGHALNRILATTIEPNDAQSRRIKEMRDEGWDLFLHILHDGAIVVTAVSNIDSKPPTLLRTFTLQQLPQSTLPISPSYMHLIPNSDPFAVTLVLAPPLYSFKLSLMSFFDAKAEGLRLGKKLATWLPDDVSGLVRFVRTPEGRGLGVIRQNGGGEAWRIMQHGSRLARGGKWRSADHIVILQQAATFATYSNSDSTLTLYTDPIQRISLPCISYLFSMPSQGELETVYGITSDFSILQIHANCKASPSLTLHSESVLPLSCPPKFILPVDPMAWSSGQSWTQHDVLLSVSDGGELAFWVPEESSIKWRCTGKVRTGRACITKASCSSAKKTALVVAETNENELTIWDSLESEFAQGLEYRGFYSETVNDLDWTSTPDAQSILAIGFLGHVDLLCQQRMTYFDGGPGWALCFKIDIGSFISYPICDSIWLADGSLLVGAGHQMYLYGSRPQAIDAGDTLFEYVARRNGPLEDYHPQMLLQCLLWNKIELVKDIIVNMAKDIEAQPTGEYPSKWTSVPIERFLSKDQPSPKYINGRRQYTSLFQDSYRKEDSEKGFSRPLVTHLLETLENRPLPHLTPNEHAHLLVLIQTTLEIDEQRRALDANGLRYLITMRSFYILNYRASAPSSPQSKGTLPRQTGRRERLRYRDMIWAFHSESQQLLLDASISACNGKMCWADARALGVPIWLNSIEMLRSQFEVIARNEYMAGDNRDPVSCSLYYFALGKVKLVHGLWRQAVWHKEQALMLKFLGNNFSMQRWRTAALKNAYALLSKQRFEYAAAFFLLGDALKDAVNVCIKQLGDFQLAIALARIVEQRNDGPVLLDILNTTVLPLAFKDGNRWLASWAFWLLNRRDLSVRILLTPLQDIADALDIKVDIGEPHYDDPSLALLFSQLRSKTLQTAKGTSEISGRLEFNFVLQMARVFCRMGCHILALDLVRSWEFDRPPMVVPDRFEESVTDHVPLPPSPTATRRSMFDLAHRRRSSIMIDMQIPSLPPTRPASPKAKEAMPPVQEEPMKEESDFIARKVNLGNLMKTAKQDVTVPEFDINSFF